MIRLYLDEKRGAGNKVRFMHIFTKKIKNPAGIRVVVFFFIANILLSSFFVNALSEEEIKDLISLLGCPLERYREEALSKIQFLSAAEFAYLFKSFKTGNVRVRRGIIQALSTTQLKEAVPFLVETLKDKDAGVQDEAVKTLTLLMGAQGREALHKAQSELQNPKLKEFEDNWLIEGCLQIIVDKIPVSGEDIGSYEGQYKDIALLGPQTAFALFKILADKSYNQVIRQMACEAIGEVKNKDVIPKLRQFFRKCENENENEKNKDNNVEYRNIVAGVMAVLGDRSAVDQLTSNYINKINRGEINSKNYWDLAYIYLRVKQYKEALDYFNKCIEIDKEEIFKPTAYYNIACIYSLQHESDLAFASLNQAILYGYRDLAWMKEDGDLAYIRKDPRFNDIVNMLKPRGMRK